MKGLVDYIYEHMNEAYEAYRLNEVVVKYYVKPSTLYIQAPENYQENDIEQYMNDAWLNKLPSGRADEFFGPNADSIYDLYFEYDGFEHMPENYNMSSGYIEWDAHYNNKENKDEILNFFKITNLRYIIKFDRFDLLDGTDENAEDALKSIFSATVSNSTNKYPVDIELRTDSIKFTK